MVTSQRIVDVDVNKTKITVGSEIQVEAIVNLGQLTPDDVRVQLYYGTLDSHGNFAENGHAVDMKSIENGMGQGEFKFGIKIKNTESGECGISVRILPYHEYMSTMFQPA